MRTVKLILGLACFVAALLPGLIALLVYSNLGTAQPFQSFVFASLFVLFGVGLVRVGRLLIVRRDSLLSKTTKVMMVVTAVAGVCPAAWMLWSPAYRTSASAACINNLRQLDSAKQQWALENGKNTNDVPSWDGINLYIGRGVKCPKGGTYILGRVSQLPKCSIGGPNHTLKYVDNEVPWFAITVVSLGCISVGLQLVVARRHSS